MKKIKQYLIIPITEVKDKTDLAKDLSKSFNDNYVTKRHQKIVLKLSFDDIHKSCDAYELVTHERYFFQNSLIKTILSFDKTKKVTLISNNTMISVHPKFVSLKEVKALYEEIILADEARDYEESIKEVLLSKQDLLFPKRKVKLK